MAPEASRSELEGVRSDDRCVHEEVWEKIVTNSRITRFCACCGRPVVLVRIVSQTAKRIRFYSDDTGHFYYGRVFLCSEECCASIVKQFGSVDAFQEWVCAPLCTASVGSYSGEE